MRSFTKPAVQRGPALVVLALVATFLACPVSPLRAQEKDPPDGLFVTVSNPIDSGTLSQIRSKLDKAIINGQRRIGTVIFDFNPKGQPSASSNFGSCYDLAQFILNLKLNLANPRYPQIKTVAFVHNEVAKHTVLPVLACSMIVMSSQTDPGTGHGRARIGDVQRDLTLSQTEEAAYRDIARRRENFSPDLVERMMFKNHVLKAVSYQEKANTLTQYLSQQNYDSLIARLIKDGAKWKDIDLPVGLQTRDGMFDSALGEKVNLCTIKDTRLELLQALNLPRKSMTEDWHLTYVPWRIDVHGPLDRGKLRSLERRTRSAVGKGANFIIFQITGPGGDITDVASKAEFLRDLKDANFIPIRTVAFIPPGESLGAATFLALGCNEIVMGPTAVLADFAYLKPDELRSAARMLVPLAKEQGYPALLFEASLDRNLVLYRAHPLNAVRDWQLITEEELRNDEKGQPPRWVSSGRLDRPAGEFQKITAALAREFRIAQTVEVLDYGQVYAHYGIDPQKVRVSRDDWLDEVAEFFREPLVNFLLIMIGIIGLIMELKMPGTTVPGVVAAICFVLFFWAYSFVGEFMLLAVLLFLLGLILIGLEVFVIPGFGFTGITGLVLVISSLALATVERMPQSPQDWVDYGTTLGTFGLSLLAAFAGALMLAWYLPSIPYANRLVLKPPSEEEELYDAASRGPAHAALLGAIGVAATPLRPAGKAQFGDDFLDVIAEGDFVKPGCRVQVIELEGNRIVVKEI